MTVTIEDPKSPINAAVGGKDFQISDQAFQLPGAVLRDHLHMLLRIDAVKSPKPGRVSPVRAKDMDFPMSWIPEVRPEAVFTSASVTAPRSSKIQRYWNTCWRAPNTRWAIRQRTIPRTPLAAVASQPVKRSDACGSDGLTPLARGHHEPAAAGDKQTWLASREP
ncbi:MAG: hypothetical protein M3R55_11675 [Acidobacteriota bacterium]|nr:hypothetical protein [Acidobacteriota bacterium]